MSDLPRPDWPANRYPTAEELRDYFLGLTAEQQSILAADFVRNNQEAMRCFEQDHARGVEYHRSAAIRLAEQRDRARDIAVALEQRLAAVERYATLTLDSISVERQGMAEDVLALLNPEPADA